MAAGEDRVQEGLGVAESDPAGGMVQLRRLRLLATVLLLLVFARPTWAADLAVSVVALSSPVSPCSDATRDIQTTPGATYAIRVNYKSGPSRANGLVPKR